MQDDFISSGRSVSDLKAHLVLVTKYRKDVFTGLMLKKIEDIVSDLCTNWHCKLIEFNGEANHVHILFQYYPQMELPKFISNLKSVTSRKIRSEFASEIALIYWKKVLWSESYFIASCGGVSISVLRKYIEGQDRPE